MKDLKMTDLHVFLKKPLVNGEELNGRQPYTDLILSSVKRLQSSKDKESIKKDLRSLNDILQDETLSETHPLFLAELNESIKSIFEIPRVSVGQKASDTVLNSVLLENEDLSVDLFSKMINNNFIQTKKANTLDLDLSSVLYMAQLDACIVDDVKSSILMDSEVIRRMFYNEKIKKTLSFDINEVDGDEMKMINGFKSLDSLIFISEKIKKHITKETDGDMSTVSAISMIEKELAHIKSIQQETLDENELKNEESNLKKMKEKIDSLNLSYISSSDSDFRLENDKLKNKAKMDLIIKENVDREMRELRQNQLDSIESEATRFNEKHRIAYKTYLSGGNPFLSQVNLNDEWGNKKATFANFSITGQATINRDFITDPIALKAVFYQLMKKNPPKKGEEFNLYLNFDGDKSAGSTYIISAIETAIKMSPPILIENIHVPKRFLNLLQKIKEDNSFVMSAHKIEGVGDVMDAHDFELEDLIKSEKLGIIRDNENASKIELAEVEHLLEETENNTVDIKSPIDRELKLEEAELIDKKHKSVDIAFVKNKTIDDEEKIEDEVIVVKKKSTIKQKRPSNRP